MTLKFLSIKKITPILVCAIALSACVKKKIDFDNMADQQWTPEVAVPLVNSSFTIKDILVETNKNGNISVGADGFCTLIYKGNLFSVKGTDFIPLVNNNISSSYSVSASDALTINSLPVGSSATIPFSTLGSYITGNSLVKIDELTFKTGDLNVGITSTFKQNSVITITIPTAKKLNVAFTETIAVQASTGSNVTVAQTFDLSGYNFDMTNGGTTTNKFNINYSVKATKTSASSLPGEQIQISQGFTNQSFSLIKGDVGTQGIVATVDTVAISIFKNAVPNGGDFSIKYTQIKFNIENSYGLPIRLNNLTLKPYGPGQDFSMYPIVPLPAAYALIDINAPTAIGDSAFTYPPTIGGPTETILNAIINKKPKNFIYQVGSLTNPTGTPVTRNFITDKSQFRVDMQLEIPLDGKAWDFVFRDTIPFKFSEDASGKINSLTFRNYVNNGFPFDVGINLDFVDSSYVVQQTLNPNAVYSDVIPSASIDGNGKVVSSTEKTTDFVLNKTQIDNLKNVKHIIVRATGKTTNAASGTGPDVKIYDYYRLAVKMGIKGEFNIPMK